MPHTVLFVDDEPNVTQALKNILRKEKYTIISATSADQALKLLGEQTIDVVVSDEQMPGMSGSELLTQIRQKYPGIIRIMLTGQASSQAAFRAISDGNVYRFLIKPCNGLDLAITIRRALEYKDLLARTVWLAKSHSYATSILKHLEEKQPGIIKAANVAPPQIDPGHLKDDSAAMTEALNSELKTSQAMFPDLMKAPAVPHTKASASSDSSPAQSPPSPSPAQPAPIAAPTRERSPSQPAEAAASDDTATSTSDVKSDAESFSSEGAETLQDLKPLMTRSDIYEILDECEELKGMSPTVAQLLQLTRNPRCSIENVVRVVKQDQAISLKVLKIANSVVYTRGEPVNTIQMAVMRIGLAQIRQVVMNISVIDQFKDDSKKTSIISTPKFWEHSISTGLITAEIARFREAKDNDVDAAFTMGLLHDVGKMVYLDILHDRYVQVLEMAVALQLPLEQVESRMLLVNHADAMDRILHKWGFSKELVNPIALHQLSMGNIRRMAPRTMEEVATLALANRLSHALLLGTSGNLTLYPTEEFAAALKLKSKLIHEIEENIPSQTDDFKFSLLSASDQENWPRMKDELAEQLNQPFHPLCVSAEPDFDSIRIFCDRLRAMPLSDEQELPAPNVAIVHIKGGREKIQMTTRLKAAEAQAKVEQLPVVILSPKGDIQLEDRAMFGRNAQCLAFPVNMPRLIKAINNVTSGTPAGVS